jgi:hypothetical protein
MGNSLNGDLAHARLPFHMHLRVSGGPWHQRKQQKAAGALDPDFQNRFGVRLSPN